MPLLTVAAKSGPYDDSGSHFSLLACCMLYPLLLNNVGLFLFPLLQAHLSKVYIEGLNQQKVRYRKHFVSHWCVTLTSPPQLPPPSLRDPHSLPWRSTVIPTFFIFLIHGALSWVALSFCLPLSSTPLPYLWVKRIGEMEGLVLSSPRDSVPSTRPQASCHTTWYIWLLSPPVVTQHTAYGSCCSYNMRDCLDPRDTSDSGILGPIHSSWINYYEIFRGGCDVALVFKDCLVGETYIQKIH